jgi:2-haloacid dehalogenase
MDRWATFDCYGTLVDWNGGIGRELERLFGPDRSAQLLHAYHAVEPQVERESPGMSYRVVMATTLGRIADVPAGEEDALGRSLPSWPVFTEVPKALEEARSRGWKLCILSNTDREFIDASMARIGVRFELAIVASEIGSYKPAHRHWEEFYARTSADPAGHVHVGASLYHDVAPARELGIQSVWINRLGEEPRPQPDVEQRSLSGLADSLDSLVP